MPLANPPQSAAVATSSGPSFTVVKSGSTFVAYNVATGAIQASGASARLVLQAAINQAAAFADGSFAKGGWVQLGPGEFPITSPGLSITADGIRLSGQSAGSTVLKQSGNMASATTAIVNVGVAATTKPHNVAIDNLQVVGDNAQANGVGVSLIANSSRVEHVSVRDMPGYGLYTNGLSAGDQAYNNHFHDIESFNNYGSQYRIDDYTSDMELRRCYAFWGSSDAARTTGGHGFEITGAGNVKFSDCHAYFNTKNGWNLDANAQHATFTDCTGESNHWHGVHSLAWYTQIGGASLFYNNGIAPTVPAGIADSSHVADVYLSTARYSNVVGAAFGKYTGAAACAYNLVLNGGNGIAVVGCNFTGAASAFLYVNNCTHSVASRNTFYAATTVPTKPVEFAGANYGFKLLPGDNVTGTRRLPLCCVSYQDDFSHGGTGTGALGELGWNTAHAGTGTNSYQAGVQDHPGILQLSTGGTSGGIGAIRPRGNNLAELDTTSLGFDIQFVARLNTNDANTAMRLGLGTDPGGTSFGTNGIFFEKAAADTSWFGNLRSGSADNRTAAILACDTSWHTFRIRRIDATTVGFSIDDGAEVTATTGLASAAMQSGAQIVNSAAATKTIDIDWFSLELSNLAR